MRILIDMDDTIAGFDQGFLGAWQAKYPDRPWIPLEERRTFYIAEQYPLEFREDIFGIFTTPGFIRSLPIIEGSQAALTEMEQMGFELFICTTPFYQYENCVLEKYQWVEEHLGRDWTQRIILTHDKTLIQADLIIDDKPVIIGVQNPPTWKHVHFARPYNTGTLNWGNWKSVLGLTQHLELPELTTRVTLTFRERNLATMPRISVNNQQAQKMGRRLVELNWKSAGYDALNAAVPSGTSRQARIDYFFFTSMLLFDFKNVVATLADGRALKGTDVFFYLARRAEEEQPGFWSAAALSQLSQEDLNRAFSLNRDPSQPDLPRLDERFDLLRDAALMLNERWEGSAAHLLDAHPYLRPVGEEVGLLYILLTSFRGYNDPLFKKVFVLLKALDVLGIWSPLDPQHVQMPVDYHVIRLALRNGTVTVHDAALAEKLRQNQPITAEEEQDIRQVVMEAYHEMIASSGLSVYFVDEVFWLVGRSCCHYARPPRCTTCDFTDCGVQPAFSYTCAGFCPLAAACLGAKDQAYTSLLEPNVVTTYY